MPRVGNLKERKNNAKKTVPRTKGGALDAESEMHAGRVEDDSDPSGLSQVIAHQPGPKHSMEL